MIDTPPTIQARYRQLLMQRSGADRLRMGCEMFDAARALVRARLGDPRGSNRTPKFNAQLFLRTYGRDFDPETSARIIARLERP